MFITNFIFSSFKLFLELEPEVRDAIFKFYESKYEVCLTILNKIKVLNIYLDIPFILFIINDFNN